MECGGAGGMNRSGRFLRGRVVESQVCRKGVVGCVYNTSHPVETRKGTCRVLFRPTVPSWEGTMPGQAVVGEGPGRHAVTPVAVRPVLCEAVPPVREAGGVWGPSCCSRAGSRGVAVAEGGHNRCCVSVLNATAGGVTPRLRCPAVVTPGGSSTPANGR